MKRDCRCRILILKGAKMRSAAINRGHRGDLWRGAAAGSAGNPKAEDELRAGAGARMSLATGGGAGYDGCDSSAQGRWRLCRDRLVLVDEPTEHVVPTDRE